MSIIYLDTKGDFIADRLLEYLKKQNLKHANVPTNAATKDEFGTSNVPNHVSFHETNFKKLVL